MTNQVIPTAAIEEAAAVLWSRSRVDSWEDAREYLAAEFRHDARLALEAAAPHMLQSAKYEAWDEGFAVGWDCEGDVNDNPYRPTL